MTKRTKIIRLTVFFALIVFAVLITVFIGIPFARNLSNPEGFRTWVADKGIWGYLAYIGMVIFQVVVAIVPGEPFELAAGYAFGLIKGTILFYIGAAIGGALVFLIARRFGRKVLDVFFSNKDINEIKFLKNNEKNRALFFIIFALPGTPKDLLSYFAGLTSMTFSQWMFISLVGRIPSVMSSIIVGDQFGKANYLIALAVYGITTVLTAAGFIIYKKIQKKKDLKNDDEDTSSSEKTSD